MSIADELRAAQQGTASQLHTRLDAAGTRGHVYGSGSEIDPSPGDGGAGVTAPGAPFAAARWSSAALGNGVPGVCIEGPPPATRAAPPNTAQHRRLHRALQRSRALQVPPSGAGRTAIEHYRAALPRRRSTAKGGPHPGPLHALACPPRARSWLHWPLASMLLGLLRGEGPRGPVASPMSYSPVPAGVVQVLVQGPSSHRLEEVCIMGSIHPASSSGSLALCPSAWQQNI